jgi:hypothetical protein
VAKKTFYTLNFEEPDKLIENFVKLQPSVDPQIAESCKRAAIRVLDHIQSDESERLGIACDRKIDILGIDSADPGTTTGG